MPKQPILSEKSPVTEDYEGLQLDLRPKPPEKDPTLFNTQRWSHDDLHNQAAYYYEKRSPPPAFNTAIKRPYPPAWLYPAPYVYRDGATGRNVYDHQAWSPITPGSGKPLHLDHSQPRRQRQRRICGVRKGCFWVLIGIMTALVIAGAVVAGILGSLLPKHRHPSPPFNSTLNNFSKPTFPQAEQSDVMIGSPLSVVSYDLGGTDPPAKRQTFRMYFQSLLGNIKESVSTGSGSWTSVQPIFTDALNNSGLASVTYMNGTQQQGSIYYVGTNGLLQEKRKIYSDPKYWLPGNLNNLNIPMIGNFTADKDESPSNAWNGYRIAAVTSANFSGGPQARVFYHAQALNGSTYVQEMIWYMNNDTWGEGSTISGVWPGSYLAASIDESIGMLRLFYSAGNHTLQESWLSLNDTRKSYIKGLTIFNLLSTDTACIASVSANGTTYLYHYASGNYTANTGFHELTITGTPGSISNPESFNLSEPLVFSPCLPSGTNASLYQPLSAAKTSVAGLSEQIFVYYADKPTGDPSSNATGYNELAQVGRPAGNVTWPDEATVQIPLGNDNSQPS